VVELVLLFLFSAGLLACVAAGLSILYAMLFGYILFFLYGRWKKYAVRQVLHFSVVGIHSVQNVLLNFVLIGMITAAWRASGTIACIVYYAAGICIPSAILLVTFLLCCLVSFLTGTSFGSAATIGVICMTIATGMGIPPLYTGGAILSGVYFGDRCSPMSTSALLISELTGTNIFRNIAVMMRTGWVPLVLSSAVYWILGYVCPAEGNAAEIRGIFPEQYTLSLVTLLPAAVILLFSLLKIHVKITLGVSSICAFLIACQVQKISLLSMLQICVFGFHPENPALAALMSGGGIYSMSNVFLIVCISSCYAGIFKETGFLDSIQAHLLEFSKMATPFGAILLTAVVTSIVSCNQTLSIILTQQLCQPTIPDAEEFASHLENTVVVIAGLVPWSIACAVPLASIGAPTASVLTACYLYLLPLYHLCLHIRSDKPPFKSADKPSAPPNEIEV